MKKGIYLLVMTVIFLTITSTLSADWVSDLRASLNKEGSVVGAGGSQLRTLGPARNAARLMAMAEITEQFKAMITSSIEQASDTVYADLNMDISEWTVETIKSRSSLAADGMVKGARIVREERDRSTNEYWVVVEIPGNVYKKQAEGVVESVGNDIQAKVKTEIEKMPAASRPDPLELHRFWADDATRRMNEEMDRLFGKK